MKKDKVVKNDILVKEEKAVKRKSVAKKEKVARKVKEVKTEKIVNKTEAEDIAEYEWKMKSNVHVRILSESKCEFNPDSKILYASKSEVEELEKESDTLVITISFEGDIKDDSGYVVEIDEKIDNDEPEI